MPIHVECPTCYAKMKAPDNAAGRKTKCPKCGTSIVVPGPVCYAEPIEDDTDWQRISARIEALPVPVAMQPKPSPPPVSDPAGRVSAEVETADDASGPSRLKGRTVEEERVRPKKESASRPTLFLALGASAGVALLATLGAFLVGGDSASVKEYKGRVRAFLTEARAGARLLELKWTPLSRPKKGDL